MGNPFNEHMEKHAPERYTGAEYIAYKHGGRVSKEWSDELREQSDHAKEIVLTLRSANNEGTESPYWILIDPSPVVDYVNLVQSGMTPDIECARSCIESAITGPFFSREDAENYHQRRHYDYSKSAYVYCFSGYWSQKYKDFCRGIKNALKVQDGKEKARS